MRVITAVIIAICFIGVASATSIEKRNFFDDALRILAGGFINITNYNITVEKRATNPLELINDLGNIGTDPAKFAQDFLKVLAEMALAQGRRKRDLFGDLQKFGETAQEKGQEALSNLKDTLENLLKENPFFQQVSRQFGDEIDETSTDLSIVKRNIFGDIAKFNGELLGDVKEYFEGLFDQIKDAASDDDDSETATISV